MPDRMAFFSFTDNCWSFRDIPPTLKAAIGDFSKVSARTASEIRMLCNRDPINTHALITVGAKIAAGIGAQTLHREIYKYLTPDLEIDATQKVFSHSGQHLFTWRKEGNGST